MNSMVVIPSWAIALLLAFSCISLIQSLIAVHVSFKLDWKQTCPLLSAGLSFVYIFLSADLFAYSSMHDIQASFRHLAWLGAAVFTLGLTINSTRAHVQQLEAYQKLAQKLARKKGVSRGNRGDNREHNQG